MRTSTSSALGLTCAASRCVGNPVRGASPQRQGSPAAESAAVLRSHPTGGGDENPVRCRQQRRDHPDPARGLVPVNAGMDGRSGLHSGQILHLHHDERQRQSGRRFGWWPAAARTGGRLAGIIGSALSARFSCRFSSRPDGRFGRKLVGAGPPAHK